MQLTPSSLNELKKSFEALREWVKYELLNPVKDYFKTVVTLSFIVGFLAVIGIYVVLLISPLLLDQYTDEILAVKSYHLLSLLIFFAAGLSIYVLRRMSIRAFAILEISSAIVLASTAIRTEFSQSILFWAAMITSLYLIVRGLDNFRIGWGSGKQIRRGTYTGSSKVDFQDAVNNALQGLYYHETLKYFRTNKFKRLLRRDKRYREAYRCRVETYLQLDQPPSIYKARVSVERVKEREKEEFSDKEYAARKTGVRPPRGRANEAFVGIRSETTRKLNTPTTLRFAYRGRWISFCLPRHH